MKRNQFLLFVLLVALLSSCYSSKITYKSLSGIQRGMSPKEVIALLGEPQYRSFDEKGETLEFRSSEYSPARVVRIKFVDDKVVEMKSFLYRDANYPKEAETNDDKKEEKSAEEDTSSKVIVTPDGKHFVKHGSIIVTPEGKHVVLPGI